MDRAELSRPTRDELIELVLRLQELVGALAAREAPLAELEAEVARRGGATTAPTRCSASSAPHVVNLRA